MGTVLNEELVKSIDIETADEFLHAISPLGKVFDRNYLPGGWLYRGHSDSRWPLLPTALRSSTVLKLREWTTVEETVRAQVHEEVRLLREFFNTADRSGLPLPEDSQHLRTELADWINDSTLSDTLRRRNLPWPPDEFLALLALAQHHGLPTRLLDWSGRAEVAAYFAASGAAKWLFKPHAHERRDATHLCVWGICDELFVAARYSGDLAGSNEIQLVTTPAADNPNLKAQRGVFLLQRPRSMNPDSAVDQRPWDTLVRESFGSIAVPGALVQVRLKIEEAPRLLRMLAHQDVHAASVFPGYDGVVSAIEEQRYWESGDEASRRKRGRRERTT